MDRVIFACVHNAGRSQMAAAFFADMADPARAAAVSAGTQPGDRVHPEVVTAMREIGIDLGGNQPRLLTDELARGASLLVTMGCGEACPYVPGLERDDATAPLIASARWSCLMPGRPRDELIVSAGEQLGRLAAGRSERPADGRGASRSRRHSPAGGGADRITSLGHRQVTGCALARRRAAVRPRARRRSRRAHRGAPHGARPVGDEDGRAI